MPCCATCKLSKPGEQEKQRKTLLGILDTEIQLRSKKELIERFIEEHFPAIPKEGDVSAAFDKYWTKEKHKAIQVLSEDEGLDIDGLQKLIGDYLFTEKTPLPDTIIAIAHARPQLKERLPFVRRITDKIKLFVETFIDGVD